MMRAFSDGNYGESKVKVLAADRGLVERRREESAGACEESAVGDSGSEEVASIAGGCGAEGDETGN
jgi:hypothetical protein